MRAIVMHENRLLYGHKGEVHSLVFRTDDRWVTMMGNHVLIGANGYIKGGAGGRLTGRKFGTVFKDYEKGKTKNGKTMVRWYKLQGKKMVKSGHPVQVKGRGSKTSHKLSQKFNGYVNQLNAATGADNRNKIMNQMLNQMPIGYGFTAGDYYIEKIGNDTLRSIHKSGKNTEITKFNNVWTGMGLLSYLEKAKFEPDDMHKIHAKAYIYKKMPELNPLRDKISKIINYMGSYGHIYNAMREMKSGKFAISSGLARKSALENLFEYGSYHEMLFVVDHMVSGEGIKGGSGLLYKKQPDGTLVNTKTKKVYSITEFFNDYGNLYYLINHRESALRLDNKYDMSDGERVEIYNKQSQRYSALLAGGKTIGMTVDDYSAKALSDEYRNKSKKIKEAIKIAFPRIDDCRSGEEVGIRLDAEGIFKDGAPCKMSMLNKVEAQNIAKKIIKTFDNFPSAKGLFPGIAIEKLPSWISGQTDPETGLVQLNSVVFNDRRALKTMVEDRIKTGWFAKGSSEYKTIPHEYTHAIEKELNRIVKGSSSGEYVNGKLVKVSDDIMKKVQKTPRYKNVPAQKIWEEVSGYAADNKGTGKTKKAKKYGENTEFLAEAVAAYLDRGDTGEDDVVNIAGREFMTIVKKYLG